MTKKLTFLHISKTAGTSVRFALEESLGEESRTSGFIFQGDTNNINIEELTNDNDFITGHFGFNFANSLDLDIITVLRNPIDRLKSLYLFWHTGEDKNDATKVFELVRGMTFKQFLESRDPRIVVERDNCMTFQLAGDHSYEGRKQWENSRDDDIIKKAFENLKSCKVIGFQENMSAFSKDLKEILSLDVKFKKNNVTKSKEDLPINSPLLRNELYNCIYMDIQLYFLAQKYWQEISQEKNEHV